MSSSGPGVPSSHRQGPSTAAVLAVVVGVLLSVGGSTCVCCVGWVWVAGRSAAAPSFIDPSIPLDQELDITYVERSGKPLKLDLYAPKGLQRPVPVVVCIHGGGWFAGNKEQFGNFARYYAQQGFVAVSVQYRLAPGDRYPAQIEDVKCAIRWLRANAEKYHVDGDKLAVVGASAGGHLALLAGLMDDQDAVPADATYADQSSKAQAVVNYFGPADLMKNDWPAAVEQMLVNLIGGDRTKLAQQFAAASPVTYIDPADPPVITFHGTTDPLVPYNQATELHAALDEAGVENHLETVEGQGHGFRPADSLRTLEMSRDFLIEQLGDPNAPRERE